jgi:Family of unknown function (DUF5675)
MGGMRICDCPATRRKKEVFTMIALRLTREVMNASCCRGKLEVLDSDGEVVQTLFTIEKPWLPNSSGGRAGEPFKSCVSEGTYALTPFVRPNGDKVWMLSNPDLDVFKLDTDIPPDRKGKGRFLILIHVANRARDVVGCIGPGKTARTDPDGTLMVTSSRDAMKDLHKRLDGRRNLEIEIVNAEEALPGAMRGAAIVAAVPKATAAAAPAARTPNFHSWVRVPQGSRLVISLSGTTRKNVVTGSGTIRSDNSPPRDFHDDEVQPGPLVVQLVGQDSATVLLNLQFGTAATADVTAFVEDSAGGNRIPVDYHETFARQQGDAEKIVFQVITV